MDVDEQPPPLVTCVSCGRQEQDLPLSWSMQTSSEGRLEHLCPDCARQNIRAIEGKLDAAWW